MTVMLSSDNLFSTASAFPSGLHLPPRKEEGKLLILTQVARRSIHQNSQNILLRVCERYFGHRLTSLNRFSVTNLPLCYQRSIRKSVYIIVYSFNYNPSHDPPHRIAIVNICFEMVWKLCLTFSVGR
jgi:hypothetical protein